MTQGEPIPIDWHAQDHDVAITAAPIGTDALAADTPQATTNPTNPNRHGRMNRLRSRVLATALVLGLGGGLIAVAGSGDSAADNPNKGDLTTQEIDEITRALTVDTTSVDCIDVANQSGGIATVYNRTKNEKGVKYDVGALKPVGDGADQASRLWSDAISTKYSRAENDRAGLLNETFANLCEDPEFGVTLANLFANMDVHGIKVVDLNDWLKPFAGDPANINDRAAQFMPLLDKDKDEVTEALAKQAADKNREYQKLAEELATMLTRFDVLGVSTGQTVLNYHLKVDGLVVGKLPEVEFNATQGQAKALMFALTAKMGDKCKFIEIGFNIGDKRPEQFKEVCVPSATTTTKPGETTTSTKPRSTTTTRPGSTTTTRPGSTTTTKPGETTTTTRPGSTTTTRPGSTTTTSTTTTTTTIPKKNPEPTPGPGTPNTTVPPVQGPPTPETTPTTSLAPTTTRPGPTPTTTRPPTPNPTPVTSTPPPPAG